MLHNEYSRLLHSTDASAVVDNESGEVAVELYVNTVPTLLGATDCIQAGILSSLQPQVCVVVYMCVFVCVVLLTFKLSGVCHLLEVSHRIFEHKMRCSNTHITCLLVTPITR